MKLIVSLAISFSAAILGSLATIPSLDNWYESLAKPPFNPPNEVFGPVWTTLYTLIGISLFLVWIAQSERSKLYAYAYFGIQLGLNVLWSVVFFGFHQLDFAVVVILTLLANIFLTAKEFYGFSQLAAWLLVPYAAWVSFATVLNVSIALLN